MTAEYHLYGNGGSGGPVDYSTPLATVAGASWTPAPLAFPGDYTFAVRAFDPATGYEEQNVDARTRVILDAGGNDVTGRPTAPTGLGAVPIAGGKLRVRWRWSPLAPGANVPTGFHVYAGIGSPDYTTVLATVPYSGSPAAVADLSGLTPGQAYAIGVRAYNAAAEEPNTITATATPDATGPAAVANLTITPTSRGS